MTEAEHCLRVAETFRTIASMCRERREIDGKMLRVLTADQARSIAADTMEHALQLNAPQDECGSPEEYVASWDVGSVAYLLRKYENGDLLNYCDRDMDVALAQDEKMDQVEEVVRAFMPIQEENHKLEGELGKARAENSKLRDLVDGLLWCRREGADARKCPLYDDADPYVEPYRCKRERYMLELGVGIDE